MTVTTWIHQYTGLPSFYLDGDDTNAAIYADDRLINPSDTHGAPTAFSDPFATPGVPTTYRIGTRTVTMVRDGGTMGTQIVTDLNGNQVPGLGAQPVTTLHTWRSNVKTWDTGAVRYPATPPLRTGETHFIVYDPTRENDVWRILQSRSPVIFATGAPVPGHLPLVAAIITDVTHTWVGHTGHQRFNAKWTEYAGYQNGNPFNTPVVTWGAWDAVSTWRARSYVELLREFAGMP